MRHVVMGLVLGCLLMGGTAFGAGDLIVEGTLGVGLAAPLYKGDFSTGGEAKSALHFSKDGTDTGGWITSLMENNFWLSSGAMYQAGGWVQKSPTGDAVLAGSGALGYRILTRSGCPVNSTTCPTPVVFQVTLAGKAGIGTSATTDSQGPAISTATGAILTAGGVWQNLSSREIKDNIEDLSTEAALAALQMLNPVTYTCVADPEEKHVGFIAEDMPDLVAAKNRDSLSPMDIAAVLTKVVQEQQRRIEKLESMLLQTK